MTCYDPMELEKLEKENLLIDKLILLEINKTIEQKSYNQAIDDAADLLNCVDLPRDELAAAVRKLKK
jgi:hypothetical protein